ncbi:MAG: hypothetical protein AAF074_08060 [Pseudomonadota bacterium]
MSIVFSFSGRVRLRGRLPVFDLHRVEALGPLRLAVRRRLRFGLCRHRHLRFRRRCRFVRRLVLQRLGPRAQLAALRLAVENRIGRDLLSLPAEIQDLLRQPRLGDPEPVAHGGCEIAHRHHRHRLAQHGVGLHPVDPTDPVFQRLHDLFRHCLGAVPDFHCVRHPVTSSEGALGFSSGLSIRD